MDDMFVLKIVRKPGGGYTWCLYRNEVLFGTSTFSRFHNKLSALDDWNLEQKLYVDREVPVVYC